MIQTFDTDKYLLQILSVSDLYTKITGGIYKKDERPDDSMKEDVVVNTITTTQDHVPQKAVSNVNIHVPDIDVKISGQNQKKANLKRLEELSKMTADILRKASIEGMLITITNQTTVKDPEINQHFVNFRIEWNIH